jgi:hypothetical protein
MRSPALVLLVAAALGLSSCAASSSGQQPPTKWTTGFWVWGDSPYWEWRNSPAPSVTDTPVDVLFVQAGSIHFEKNWRFPNDPNAGEWSAGGELPDGLPAAREYWAVFRYETPGVPDTLVIPDLTQTVAELRRQAAARNINLAGVQLDVDCATGSLAAYANFLRQLRKQLPPGFQLSVTALLDWFRDGTAVGEVVAATDEFVPQFYDTTLRDERHDDDPGVIAARIDAGRWGPVFNRFRKRYRIGISCFGRALALRNGGKARSVTMFRQVAPLDLATNPAFELRTQRNQEEELVLEYRAWRNLSIDYNRFEPGEGVQFVIATPELVRHAVENARKMGGYAAGVLFFRWARTEETLVMQPDDVLRAAAGSAPSDRAGVRLIDGGCAAVACVDVYLHAADPQSVTAVRYNVEASRELEYFLPERGAPARLAGPSRIEVTLPPYCARGLLYLGRAVSKEPVTFEVERKP